MRAPFFLGRSLNNRQRSALGFPIERAAPRSTSGTWTALLACVLELFAIPHACGLITFNNTLRLLLGIRALRSTRVCICMANGLAGIGLTYLVLSRSGKIGRRRWSGACHDQRSEHARGEQQGFHGGDILARDRKKSATFLSRHPPDHSLAEAESLRMNWQEDIFDF